MKMKKSKKTKYCCLVAEATANYFKDLEKIVDDSTTHVTVPTPKGWKCRRKNCPTRFKHTHSTYSIFNEKR